MYIGIYRTYPFIPYIYIRLYRLIAYIPGENGSVRRGRHFITHRPPGSQSVLRRELGEARAACCVVVLLCDAERLPALPSPGITRHIFLRHYKMYKIDTRELFLTFFYYFFI